MAGETAVDQAYAILQGATARAAAPFISWANEAAGVGLSLVQQKANYAEVNLARENYYAAVAQERGGVQTSTGGGGEVSGKYTSMATRDVSGAITGYTPVAQPTGLQNPYNPLSEPGRYQNFQNSNPGASAMPQAQAQVMASSTPYTTLTQQYIPQRADYTNPAQLGDTRTAAVESGFARGIAAVNLATGQRFGVTQENLRGAVIAQQFKEAQSQNNYKATQYFGNELQKFAENKVAVASEYHYIGKVADIPIPANPYEYQGDLAVEYLKGTPQQGKDVFSPVSGELSRVLPFGGMGLQQYQWELAKANTKGTLSPDYYNVEYRASTSALIGATGQYGPYGTLYGGPDYVGTPSSEGLRKQEATPFTTDVYNRITSVMGAPATPEVVAVQGFKNRDFVPKLD